jgi:hypothetical protein
VSLLADGLQRRNAQNLLRRLAVLLIRRWAPTRSEVNLTAIGDAG